MLVIGATAVAAVGLTSTAAQALPREECQVLAANNNWSLQQSHYWGNFISDHFNASLSLTYYNEWAWGAAEYNREC